MRWEHWLYTVPLRLRSLFQRSRVEQELDAEIRLHLGELIERNLQAGMSATEAANAARRAMGGMEQLKEECREMRRVSLIQNLIVDLHFAIRQLRKSPGFACTAIFVLGLGISAAVTIFGLVEAALIKPLPYRDQSGLVSVFASSTGTQRLLVSYLNFGDWKSLDSIFSSIDAYALNGGFTLRTSAGSEQVKGTRVTSGFFHTLGVVPALGRDFRADGVPRPRLVRSSLVMARGKSGSAEERTCRVKL